MISRSVCLFCLFILAGVSVAHANGPVDVDSFVNAHYQEYHIDTFAVEPMVWVWVDLVDMNLSQLDSLGLGTAKGTWKSSGLFWTEIPIRLIDSVRALPSVKDLHYETLQEYFAEYVAEAGPDEAIDTSGPEPLVEIEVATDGDFSQLDSVGIRYYPFGTMGHATATIPLRLKDEVVRLRTVKWWTLVRNDIHFNALSRNERRVTPGSSAHPEDIRSVREFVRAHYDEYRIDTFAVEPMIWVWVDLVDMNLSQLDSLGFGTAKGTWMSSGLFSTRIPIRLIDSVRALPSVKDLHYTTWQEYFREYIDLGGRQMAIDTSGPEPMIPVLIVTNGDFSQLDSIGVFYSPLGNEGRVIARIPLRLQPEITHLSTIQRLSIMEQDVRPLGSKPDGLSAVPNGMACGLVRDRSGVSLSAELRSISAMSGTPEHASITREAKRVGVDKEGRFCFVRLAPGLYSLVIRRVGLQHSDSAGSDVNPADSGVVCAVVEGIEVQKGKTSLVEVDVRDIADAGESAPAKRDCKTTWVPRYISE